MPPTSVFGLRASHLLACLVLALLGVGLLMVRSASMTVGGGPASLADWGERATRHAAYVALAIVAFAVAARLDYAALLGRSATLWRSPAVWMMAVAVALSAAVLVVGTEVNGARRWLRFGPVQLQPSELAKWATVAFLAWWLGRRPVPIERFWRGFVVTGLPVGAACLFVVIEDFGTAALIAVVSFAMMLAGRVKLWHLAVVLPPALLAAGYFVVGTPYRWRRMTGFLDPWADPRGEGYHMVQSLMSFATGGLTGSGLGNGIQKLGYLPEDTTDFIFAVVCEELGFFGALLLASLYLGLLLIAWRASSDARVEPTGRLLAFGVAATVGLQACVNMAVATVSMPTKGMSLPLVSAGGTGLVITAVMLGMLANVVRRSQEPEAKPM